MKYLTESDGLFSTDAGVEGSLFIPKTIAPILVGEVTKRMIPRSEVARFYGPAQIKGSTITTDLWEENTLKVNLIGEGAGVQNQPPTGTTVTLKPLKYGVRIPITREMEEDSQFMLLTEAVKLAGKRLAENETKLIIADALDSANATTGGGAALTIGNVTTGMRQLEDNDFNPTTMFIGPEALEDLRNIDTFVEADKLGSREMLETGVVGIIYGMNVIRFSANAAPSTTYSKYVYITDKENAYIMAEKRPVTIENYNLATHDMRGAVITQRIAVKALRTKAIHKITTS